MDSTLTPEQLREEAAALDQAAADSFDRSDTDGALTQWAAGLTARLRRAEADLAEAGGLIDMTALFNLDGTVASTHRQFGRYGDYWVLNDDAAARYGKRFFSPSRAGNPKTAIASNARKGFQFGTIRVRAHIRVVGGGRGLAGTVTSRVGTVPDIDALRAGEYEIITVGEDNDD